MVRLALVAGAAATTALLLRGPLADRIARELAVPVRDLAETTRAITPSSPPPSAPSAPSVSAPLPVAPPKVVTAPEPKPIVIAKSKSKPAPTRFVVTQQELEAGVAAHGWGARAIAVKDGLELHSVGRFARFGVAEGDVLQSANGHSLRTAEEALSALGKLGDSRSIVVVLRRGEKSYAVPIELVPD